MTLDLFPFTAYGGGIIVVPWDGALFTVSVVDPSGTATNNDISEAFKDGVLVAAEGRVDDQALRAGRPSAGRLRVEQQGAPGARAGSVQHRAACS